jgi:hypothetical protein
LSFYARKMLHRIADSPCGVAVQFVPERIALELSGAHCIEQVGSLVRITPAGRQALEEREGRE